MRSHRRSGGFGVRLLDRAVICRAGLFYLLATWMCATGQTPVPRTHHESWLSEHISAIDFYPPTKGGTTMFRGQLVNYQVIDDMAVYGGDIILGTTADVAASPARVATEKPPVMPWLSRRDVSAIKDADHLWPDAIIPYVIDSSVVRERESLDGAIKLWNSETVITLVPRTTESDYVRFTAAQQGCRAWIGRRGGEQPAVIGNCATYGITHEIGHAVGLNHPHARVDRDEFIMFLPDRGFDELLGPAVAPATGPYDYRSVMHWPYRYFETIPPGMPHTSSYPSYLSPGDIDGVARLYGRPPTATIISTNPAGLEIIVDEERYRTPASFDWAPGTTHVLEAPLRQGPQNGVQYVFGRWTDGGGPRHAVTGDPGTTWYQASFIEMVQPQSGLVYSDGSDFLIVEAGSDGVAVSPGVGEVRLGGLESPDGYIVQRTPIEVSANPAAGTSYRIAGWRVPGRFIEPASSRRVVPATHGQEVYPVFSDGPFFVIDWNAPRVPMTAAPPDTRENRWTHWHYYPPAVIDASMHENLWLSLWDEARLNTAIYDFQEWSDGGKDELLEDRPIRQRIIEIPPSGGELSFSYKKGHQLSTFVLPYRHSGSIRVSPSPGGFGFYDDGTTVHLTATPSRNFLRWTGDASGTATEVSVVLDRPRIVNAVFSPGLQQELNAYPRALAFVTHQGVGSDARVLDLTNESAEALPFQIHSEQGWMTIEPFQGLLSAGEKREITVTVSNSGLVPGDHQGEIAVLASSGEGDGSSEVSRVAVHHVTLETQSRSVELTDDVNITLTKHWNGRWRTSSNSPVQEGSRYVHDGEEYILEEVDGRWRTHELEDFAPRRKILGGAEARDGTLAVDADLFRPRDVAVDAGGNVYVLSEVPSRVYKIDRSGIITTLAGTGEKGFGGDGGPATEALFNSPSSVAVDTNGNVYVADTGNHRIRKIDAAGIITTLAGTGEDGHSGVGGPAIEAQLFLPTAVAVDANGNVFISSAFDVMKVDAAGIITTLAGNGEIGPSGDGGPAIDAGLYFVGGVAADANGNVYLAERYQVRKIDAAGIITTLAGTGEGGREGDGGPATEALLIAEDLAVDAAGNVYIIGGRGNNVRKIDVSGTITTIPGSYFYALFDGVAVDAEGSVYVADADNLLVRKIDSSGTTTTLAGTGFGQWWDGTSATASIPDGPAGLATDSAGNVYVADSRRVIKLDASRNVTAIAGTANYGDLGDGGPATEAWLGWRGATDVAVDASGNVYVAQTWKHRVRKIDVSGIITTIAGTGQGAYGGDGGLATEAQVNRPSGVAVDANGNLYIADTGNQRVRKIDVSGIITTIAGTGQGAYGGDGSLATEAHIRDPFDVGVDANGNVYISGGGGYSAIKATTVFKVDTSGRIGQAVVNSPHTAFAVDASGSVYLARNGRIWKKPGYWDPISSELLVPLPLGSPSDIRLSGISGIAVDSSGNVWFADSESRRVTVLERDF